MADATGQGETRRVVCAWDPAIRWPAEKHARERLAISYNESREIKGLAFLEGVRPRVFVTRRLRRSEARDVSCLSFEPLRHEAAFACGVSSVEEPDGSIVRPASGRWTSDELDAHFDNATVADVGSVVEASSSVPLGLRVSFAPPRSSVAALAAWLYPSAAPSPVDADPSSKRPEAPSAEAAITLPQSAPSGG